jgi:hypothetical protein
VNWAAVGIGAAILAFVLARIWVRRWIVKRWLNDEFTNRQAAALLFVTQLSPMLLFAGIVVISSPESMPFFLLAFILIGPIWFATWGALFTYITTTGVKEQMRKEREASALDQSSE